MSANVTATRWDRLAAVVQDHLPRGDLEISPMEDLQWGVESETSLQRVRHHVLADARTAADWYRKARRWKRRVSTTVRLVGISAVSIAGLIPLVGRVEAPPGLPAWINTFNNPIWISILLGVSAALYGFDKFWGSSTGWIRCILTEQKLRDAIERFELDWERERVAWNGRPPAPQQVDAALVKAAAFADRINAIVNEETNAWVEEFLSSYRRLEQAVRAREARTAKQKDATTSGAVLVSLTNAAAADRDSIVLAVDEGEPRPVTGEHVTVQDLTPGRHTFRVAAAADGEPGKLSDQRTIDVASGRVAVLELTLR